MFDFVQTKTGWKVFWGVNPEAPRKSIPVQILPPKATVESAAPLGRVFTANRRSIWAALASAK